MPWWLSLILGLVANLPEIISIVKDILVLIANIANPKGRSKAFSDLAAAVSSYRKTGDTKGLKDLHDQLGTVGVGPDTVGL